MHNQKIVYKNTSLIELYLTLMGTSIFIRLGASLKVSPKFKNKEKFISTSLNF